MDIVSKKFKIVVGRIGLYSLETYEIKPKTIRGADCLARVVDMRNAYRISVGRPRGKRPRET
jgi:hypothetical protein